MCQPHTHALHSPQPHLLRHPRRLTPSPYNINDSTRIIVTSPTWGTETTSQMNKDDLMTTHTTQAHIPSSKSERNLIIRQVNINGIKNKLEDLKMLIHNTHADVITIQETKLTPKAKPPKVNNLTTVRTDILHKAGDGIITLIRDNITFITPDIHSTINTHNI